MGMSLNIKPLRWPLAFWLKAALCVAAIAPCAVVADELAWPSSEDLRHLRAYDEVHPSPDGSSVLLQARESTVDGARKHVWLLDPRGGAARQLTYSPESDKDGESSPRWMPDGRSVLFVAHRGDNAELLRLSLTGGEAEKLAIEVPVVIDDSRAADALPPRPEAASADVAGAASKSVATLPVDVKSYDINPSGEWLSVIAEDPQTLGEKAQVEAKADAHWIDHETHGTHLYLWNMATHKAVAVPLADDVDEAAWSPDGARIAVVTEATHHASDLGPTRRAWMVTLAHPEKPEPLEESPGSVNSLEWDATGRELYFSAQAKRDAPPGYPDLFADELATHRVRNLTDGLDGTPVDRIVSLADGGVAVSIVRGFDWTIEQYGGDASAVPGGARVLRHVAGSMGALATNARHSAWAWIESRSGHEPEVWYAPSLAAPGERLNAPAFSTAGAHLSAQAQRIEWTFEGRTLQGLLYLPPTAAASARVPLVVEGHGGPTGAFVDQYSAYVDFLVAQGWAVFRPNPRGSTSRGAAFAAANKNDLGGGDVRDIMAGIDHVLKHYSVDGQRMAFSRLQLWRRTRRLHGRANDALPRDRQRRASDRSVQRIRHGRRQLLRPLVLWIAVAALRRRVAAEPALQGSGGRRAALRCC
jgi:dipeptidyl aminopeptidase/acylaminoacyl peptidase